MPRKYTKIHRKKRGLRKTKHRRHKRSGGFLDYFKPTHKEGTNEEDIKQNFFKNLIYEIENQIIYSNDKNCEIKFLFPKSPIITYKNIIAYEITKLKSCTPNTGSRISREYTEGKVNKIDDYIAVVDAKIKMNEVVYNDFIIFLEKLKIFEKIQKLLNDKLVSINNTLEQTDNTEKINNLVNEYNTNYNTTIPIYIIKNNENNWHDITKVVNEMKKENKEKTEDDKNKYRDLNTIDTELVTKFTYNENLSKIKKFEEKKAKYINIVAILNDFIEIV